MSTWVGILTSQRAPRAHDMRMVRYVSGVTYKKRQAGPQHAPQHVRHNTLVAYAGLCCVTHAE